LNCETHIWCFLYRREWVCWSI